MAMRLIYDVDQVRRFVSMLNFEDGPHMTCLTVRSKYDPNTKDCMFKRRVSHHSRALLRDILDFETTQGILDDQDVPISIEALVIYATTNGRSEVKAAQQVMETLTKSLFEGTIATTNMVSLSKRALHKHKAKTDFITVDIDDKSLYDACLAWLIPNVGSPAFTIETRGGFHLLYRQDAGAVLFRDMRRHFQHPKIEVLGDAMCPVPGTLQGGFEVRFID